MPKVTIIGAGSTVFTTELIGDILLTLALEHGVFAFVDIDVERLELAQRMAEFLIERTGKAWTSDGGSSYRSGLFIRGNSEHVRRDGRGGERPLTRVPVRLK